MNKEVVHFDIKTKYFLGTGWFLFSLVIAGCEYYGVI
tara:strand:- start:196 stop:306 length:111 start_codon:yes stop_codon:yes gene_type:complete